MAYHPFIAQGLAKAVTLGYFDMPVQLGLFEDFQLELSFELRLHDATRLHYDFRIRMLKTLFSLVFLDDISIDPLVPSRVKVMPDHNPSNWGMEARMPHPKPGGAPTMPVDMGRCLPILKTYKTYELEFLHQLAQGELIFRLDGTHMKGAWRLIHAGGDIWRCYKVADEFAGKGIIAPDHSIRTGKTLLQIR